MNLNKSMHRARQRGMTLIEVLLSVALLTVILGALFTSLLSSQKAYNFGMSELLLQETANRIVAQMVEKIRESSESRIIIDNDNGCVITLQRPVDHDDDGDIFDANWNVEYGEYYGNAFHLDAYCQIVFEMTGSLSEATLEDLNDDGDIADSYQCGQIRLCYYDSNGVLKEQKIISESLVFVGDTDGNQTIEPMFQRVDLNGNIDSDPAKNNCIQLRYMIMKLNRGKDPHILRMVTRISPRNP